MVASVTFSALSKSLVHWNATLSAENTTWSYRSKPSGNFAKVSCLSAETNSALVAPVAGVSIEHAIVRNIPAKFISVQDKLELLDMTCTCCWIVPDARSVLSMDM